MTQQKSMFTHEDLPLFSGTAPRARVDRFDPQAIARQLHLGQCPICEDTGLVDNRFCTCAAGDRARREQV